MSSSMGAAADCIVPNKVKRIMKEKTFRTLQYPPPPPTLLLLLLRSQEILGHLQHELSSLPECFNSRLLFCCGAWSLYAQAYIRTRQLEGWSAVSGWGVGGGGQRRSNRGRRRVRNVMALHPDQ